MNHLEEEWLSGIDFSNIDDIPITTYEPVIIQEVIAIQPTESMEQPIINADAENL